MLPPLTVFDIETTGLDPKRGHRIIEIAGVRIENGIVHEENPFTSFVNPERPLPPETRKISHICDADIHNAPTIMTVLPDFLAWTRGSMLCAHNALFDMSFLETEKDVCWGYIDLPECFCTMKLSQNLFPREFHHNLNSLADRFQMKLPENRHRALPDALLTAHILLKMLTASKITALDELRRRSSLHAKTLAS